MCGWSEYKELYVVVLGDLNARVGDAEVEGVVGKYGVAYQQVKMRVIVLTYLYLK